MLLIGLACSRALIVVRASHFTDSNRLHRRIKMQSLDIDQKESTPLAKLTRQCIWINTAFLSLGKRTFFSPFFLHATACNPSKSADLDSSFKKHLIKVHYDVSIVKPPGISLWIRWVGGARLNCLSVTETHAFIGKVCYCKRIGCDPRRRSFQQIWSSNMRRQTCTTSCRHLLKESGIKCDIYEVARSGLHVGDIYFWRLMAQYLDCVYCDYHSHYTCRNSPHPDMDVTADENRFLIPIISMPEGTNWKNMKVVWACMTLSVDIIMKGVLGSYRAAKYSHK